LIIYQKTAVKNIIPKQTLIKNNLSFLASKKKQHFPLIFYVKTQKMNFFKVQKNLFLSVFYNNMNSLLTLVLLRLFVRVTCISNQNQFWKKNQ